MMITLDMTVRDAVAELERDLGLDEAMLADALDVSRRSLRRWRAGETYPQHDARERLATLLALDKRLTETFDSRDAILEWMRGENRYLGNIRPVEAIRVGRLDCVELALDALDEGVFV